MLRRFQQISAVVAGVMAPLAVSAQNGGAVTVAPLGAPAPALGEFTLGVLAVLLTGVAVVALRRHRPAATRMLVFIAFTMTAAIGYSTASNLVISGDECHQVTQKSYDSLAHIELESQCPNPIRIIDLELHCTDMENETLAEPLPVTPCEIGLIVLPGKSCHLPSCVC